MTSFDERSIELGILTAPAWFEAADAWLPFLPLARQPLALQDAWVRHYLPAVSLAPGAGFDHALHVRLSRMSLAGTPNAEGILVAQTSFPAGHLAIGPFDSLLRLLAGVEQDEFTRTTPADSCASLSVDEGDDLEWLSRPPDARAHARVRGILERLAGVVALLDRGRAWALRVGDWHDGWHRESALAGLRDADAFWRRAGFACSTCGGPFDPSVDGTCAECLGRVLTVSAQPPADPARTGYADPDPAEDFADETGDVGAERAICSGCDEPLDPELDYCWTCQCEGQDWD